MFMRRDWSGAYYEVCPHSIEKKKDGIHVG